MDRKQFFEYIFIQSVAQSLSAVWFQCHSFQYHDRIIYELKTQLKVSNSCTEQQKTNKILISVFEQIRPLH